MRTRPLRVLAAVAALLCASEVAKAGDPIALTDRQLDSVTAAQGGPFAAVAAAAAASGLITVGSTNTTAITEVADSPFGGSTAVVTGVAFGQGMNGASPGTSSAAVSTSTEAPGNFVVNIGWNRTVYGIGSTLQVGVSSSTGLFVPGLP